MTGDITRMRTLLPEAAKFARPPISNFFVGAVVRGTTTGALYFGANVEFEGEALSQTVHAEQSAVANAWMGGEHGIDLLAVNAPPCGFCRQFLNELASAEKLVVSINEEETQPLAAFLPRSFGPNALGITERLMLPADHRLRIGDSDELAQAALRAANMSYAPYSKSFAGVAVRTSDGMTASGAYAENAAFNPSMSPLQVALSQLNLGGGDFRRIEEAVLVQTEGGLHENVTRIVLGAVCNASLRVIRAHT